jgi:anthranilate phosphoribosyltransferase
MNIQQALSAVVARQNLSQEEATQTLASIMRGEGTTAQIGGLLVGLRMKGETVDEIAGFVAAMRDAATRCPVNVPVVDIVGTGGDHAGTFNISTTTAFVVAGAGGFVAKHGNRGVSSRSGSADVLAELGVSLDLNPDQVAECVHKAGVGFLFAQAFHPAMKYVAPVRREMGLRTIFNLLGPLTNPAGTKRLVVGVFAKEWCVPLAQALGRLGTENAWVVHGSDGLDEITTTGKTFVAEWDGQRVREFEIDPLALGLELARPEELLGGDPVENAGITRAILSGVPGPKADIVILNAAAALVVTGIVNTLEEGLTMARESIGSGAALKALEMLVITSKETLA